MVKLLDRLQSAFSQAVHNALPANASLQVITVSDNNAWNYYSAPFDGYALAFYNGSGLADGMRMEANALTACGPTLSTSSTSAWGAWHIPIKKATTFEFSSIQATCI